MSTISKLANNYRIDGADTPEAPIVAALKRGREALTTIVDNVKAAAMFVIQPNEPHSPGYKKALAERNRGLAQEAVANSILLRSKH